MSRTFAAAAAASKVALLDRSIARSALLPSITYHNQFLYTQPNGALNQAGSAGTQAAPKFIANNAVHEYASQGIVNETLGVAQLTAVSRASSVCRHRTSGAGNQPAWTHSYRSNTLLRHSYGSIQGGD